MITDRTEAVEIIRSHIERITPTPNDQGGLEVELYGDLAAAREFREAGERIHQRPGRGGPGAEVPRSVSGPRFERTGGIA